MIASMIRLCVLACAATALLALPVPIAAQKPGSQAVAAGLQDEVDRERTLPYLAHTLGELHFLAYACEGDNAQRWRNRMVSLLDMEAPNAGGMRNRLVESFNAGYRAQQRYRTRCGAEAESEIRSLALRGRDLSEMMRAAYFD